MQTKNNNNSWLPACQCLLDQKEIMSQEKEGRSTE